MLSLQDLEQIDTYTTPEPERAVFVGGGLIGIEMAEMFHSRNIPVSFLVREKGYMDYVFPREESEMIGAEIRRHHIDLQLTTELKEIRDDGRGRAGAVLTDKGEIIPCGIVGLTAGVSPNVTVTADSKIETARGVLINDYFETSVERVYAAGDCAQFKNPDGGPGPLQQLWYTGRRQGAALGKILARRALELSGGDAAAVEAPPYDKGVFFNSAKFFNMEYQTYGTAPASPPEETNLFWRHPKENRSIRLLWERRGGDTRITGFNLMGVRYRHAVCERWIREEQPVEYVIKNLPEANFDPEFFTRHEKDVQKSFKQKFGARI
jgi:NADH dehydrogenase FAD-containing subunit